jgi:hypothetical protein
VNSPKLLALDELLGPALLQPDRGLAILAPGDGLSRADNRTLDEKLKAVRSNLRFHDKHPD